MLALFSFVRKVAIENFRTCVTDNKWVRTQNAAHY